MKSPPIEHVVKQLRQLAHAPAADELSDAILLESFVTRRDETAFAALLQRHGPMVAAVCRRQLRESHDAEDAFQATFLVLAKNATFIRKRQALAGWLHGVALRVCRKAKSDATRRARDEQRPNPADADKCDALTWGEIRTVLDEELARLPSDCAAPLIYCYLEGLTQDEAALRLGWSKSTLRRRLERGRRLLQIRLAQRGIALSAGLGALFLSELAASAALTTSLTTSTIKAAVLFATNATLAASALTRPIELAQAVLPSALAAKIKLLVLATLALLLTSAAGVYAYVALSKQDAPPPPMLHAKIEPKPVLPLVDLFGDPLPPEALARLGTIRLQHGSLVNAIAFAPDGKSLVTASRTGKTHQWETSTGKELKCIDHRNRHIAIRWDAVGSLAFTPDGKFLGGTRVNQLPCHWDAATGKEIRTFGDNFYRAGWIVFSPDGKTVAYGGGNTDNTSGARLYEVKSGALIHQFEAKTKMSQISFSPDKRTLASSNEDGLLFFEFVDGKVRDLPRPESKGGRFISLVFATDGKWLAAISENKKVVITEVPSGKVVRSITVAEDKDTTYSVLLTPDDKTLVTGHKDGFVRFWDARTGAKKREFRAYEREVFRIALSRDGKILATTANYGPRGSEHAVVLWDLATGKPLLPSPEPRAGIARLVVSPDSRRVALTSWDGSSHMWDPATCKQLWKTDHFGPMAFAPDGKTLICGGWSDGVIRYLDAATGKQFREVATDQKWISNLALSRDGTFLVLAGKDGFRLWDVMVGKVMQQFGESTFHFALSPDDMVLAALDSEIWIKDGAAKVLTSRVRLYDTKSGKLIREHKEPPSGAGIAFSPDGKMLAYGLTLGGQSTRWLIRIRDATNGKIIRELDDKVTSHDSLAFSPDGRTLIAGGQHGDELFLWEVATGKLRRKYLGHQGELTSVAFSPDGRWMASGASDASVLIWDAVGLRARKNAPVMLSDVVLNRLWKDLAGEDPAVAYQAICTLRSAPKQAVALLENNLKPVPRVEAKQVDDALRRLESEQFAVRDSAARELERLGEAAEPALRKALTGQQALEMRRRVDQLLERLGGVELLRQGRAFEVLENAGDAESRRLLQVVANGAPNARRTAEAKAALVRLEKNQR